MKSGLDTLGFSEKDWTDQVIEMGEKPFRGTQIFTWLQKKQVFDWSEMTDLPQKMRERLCSAYTNPCPVIVRRAKGSKVEKFLFRWEDGEVVESVLIKGERGDTACLSVQSGCLVGCPFCASGKPGLLRNLSASEIVAQALMLKRSYPRLDHIVFMGMGEPFHNYSNVMQAVRILNDSLGLNLGARRMTVSTSGVVPEIYRLAKESIQLNLAVSLGSANEETRKRLIPMARVFSLGQLLDAIDWYCKRTGRRVSLEYTLLRGINDRFKDADALAKLTSRRLVHVNLIVYNSIGDSGFKAPRDNEVKAFHDRLKRHNVAVSVRHSRGNRIRAACGQLAGQAQGRTAHD